MAAKTPLIEINSKILKWARECLGLDVQSAAKKYGVTEERLKAWESSKESPTFAQLKKLSNVLKRPTAMFFMLDIPQEAPLPNDFRVVGDENIDSLSPQTIIEVRSIRRKREYALALADSLGHKIKSFSFEASLDKDASHWANKYRNEIFKLDDNQSKLKDSNQFFSYLVSRIEKLDVLVFQTSSGSIEEFRGLSIVEKKLPIIVLNSKDTVNGRIFSLLHEFCHLLLGMSGICNMQLPQDRKSEVNKIEVFCNQFAASILVPDSFLQSIDKKKIHTDSGELNTSLIAKAARLFKVSEEVITRRLLTLGLITKEEYQIQRDKYKAQYRNYRKKLKDSKGGPPPAQIALSNNGVAFTKLVLEGFYSEKATIKDVSDFLSVRDKHLTRIEELITKKIS